MSVFTPVKNVFNRVGDRVGRGIDRLPDPTPVLGFVLGAVSAECTAISVSTALGASVLGMGLLGTGIIAASGLAGGFTFLAARKLISKRRAAKAQRNAPQL